MCIKMSKIKELLKDNKSVLVFDIDGVLALMEFGVYNHYGLLTDEEWNNACETTSFYTEDKVSKKIQDFLRNKDMNRIFVITRVNNINEIDYKKDYVNKYYNIIKDNVYCVLNDNSKVKELNEIRNKFNDIEDYQLIMIDDTTKVLTEIQEQTHYSTAHISSFLDI